MNTPTGHKQVIVIRKDLNMRKGKVDFVTGALPLL